MKKPFTRFVGRIASAGLSVLVLAGSCAKPLLIEEPSGADGGDEDLVTVTFSVGEGPSTRSTGVTDALERKIDRWALFVFDTASGWFTRESSSTGGSIPVTLRAGRRYDCHAMVNYATTGAGAFNPGSVRAPSDLTGKVAYLSDNAVGSLLMYGRAEITPAVADYDPQAHVPPAAETRSINVRRIVSRVDVRSVAVDFSGNPSLASKTFTLRHIYMTNIYRTTRYSSDYTLLELSGSRSSWYNSCGWHGGEPGEAAIDALVGDRDINAVITPGNPHTAVHSFYVFPNCTPKAADTHETGLWGIRCTRIILEATIDGDTLYYQVDVPAMERNHIYSASSITIRGRGSRDPEAVAIDPDAVEVTFSVSDGGWEGPENVLENS